MVKVLFRRPCHVPPCLINGEGGSTTKALELRQNRVKKLCGMMLLYVYVKLHAF